MYLDSNAQQTNELVRGWNYMVGVVTNEPDKNRNCIINCTWNISIIFFSAKLNFRLLLRATEAAVLCGGDGELIWQTTWMYCCITLMFPFIFSVFVSVHWAAIWLEYEPKVCAKTQKFPSIGRDRTKDSIFCEFCIVFLEDFFAKFKTRIFRCASVFGEFQRNQANQQKGS